MRPLMKYAAALATSMTMRMTKIQTRSWTCTVGLFTPRRMKVISATPVTPYVSNPSALGPTESPALSPVQSAITPGFRASSSLILKTIFIRSEPMSAIFVKIPPAIRSAAAPRESYEARARIVAGNKQQNHQHHQQSHADQHHSDAHAGLERRVVDRVRLA